MDSLEGLADKAKGLLGEHGEQVSEAVDKATDVIDEKTGGKSDAITEKIDSAAEDAIGDGNNPA